GVEAHRRSASAQMSPDPLTQQPPKFLKEPSDLVIAKSVRRIGIAPSQPTSREALSRLRCRRRMGEHLRVRHGVLRPRHCLLIVLAIVTRIVVVLIILRRHRLPADLHQRSAAAWTGTSWPAS